MHILVSTETLRERNGGRFDWARQYARKMSHRKNVSKKGRDKGDGVRREDRLGPSGSHGVLKPGQTFLLLSERIRSDNKGTDDDQTLCRKILVLDVSIQLQRQSGGVCGVKRTTAVEYSR